MIGEGEGEKNTINTTTFHCTRVVDLQKEKSCKHEQNGQRSQPCLHKIIVLSIWGKTADNNEGPDNVHGRA